MREFLFGDQYQLFQQGKTVSDGAFRSGLHAKLWAITHTSVSCPRGTEDMPGIPVSVTVSQGSLFVERSAHSEVFVLGTKELQRDDPAVLKWAECTESDRSYVHGGQTSILTPRRTLRCCIHCLGSSAEASDSR
jgi:hypothetical protein